MKCQTIKFGYFLLVTLVLITIVVLFILKNAGKTKFSSLPFLLYTEIDGYVNSTTNLSEFDAYAVFLFNPGCEICQSEATEISNSTEAIEDCCLLFLSPDSLHNIEEFIKDFRLFEKENVFYGQIKLDSVEIKFGKSTIPWTFVYDKNKKLVKSELFLNSSDLEKLLSK